MRALILLLLSSSCFAQQVVPGVVSNGNVGTSGVQRKDAQLEAVNPSAGHALVAITQSKNPGDTSDEAAVSYGAYDTTSTMRQMASISAMWANSPVPGSGFAVLRLNVDSANGGSNIFLRGFGGNNGAIFYGTSDSVPPGFPGVQINRTSGYPSLAGTNDLALEGKYGSAATIFLNAYSGGDTYFGGQLRFASGFGGCPASVPAGVSQCLRVVAPDGNYSYLPAYR
jgi:hypothetical protein